jgi:hypothetical protein
MKLFNKLPKKKQEITSNYTDNINFFSGLFVKKKVFKKIKK